MGRGGRGGHKKRLMRKDYQGDGKRDNAWNEKKTHRADQYLEAGDMHNEAFEEYYKVQDIVPEGEWQEFLDILKKPLPITFRINGSGRFAAELVTKLQTDFFSHFSEGPVMLDGELVQPPRPLPWYPSNLAWHMNFTRNQLRKLSWLAAIHEFMKVANEAGSITRQEAVSMVPPLFMDVQPHHRVLDMCAAPGSKTFQLLEMLHNMEGADSSSGSSTTPSGFVVANDADAQRCNLLTHQTKRMCSPCLMVTNHNGEQFPKITGLQPAPGSAAAAAAAVEAAAAELAGNAAQQQQGEGEVMRFDRILCDVPCSGDGTMRKAPDIWRRWSVNNGNGLHNMQLRIALHAVRLLKVGGRMVYSTCTPNPIEDEAVVAELLVRCKGALQLLDVSDQLPELKRCAGKRKWLVRDKHQWYSSWEEAAKVGFKLDPTMFSSPEKQQLPLERCMRILPHHQDTGGFFVAVLQKVAETPDLPDPSLAHRFTRIITAGRDGRLIKIDGADPHQGAEDAAAYALEAAEQAIAALEAGDAAAATKAANAAAAAASRGGLAQDAATEIYKNQRRYDSQEARKQQQLAKQQQRQQDAATAGADEDAAAVEADADADVEAMEGVETAGDDVDADADAAAAAADEAEGADDTADGAADGKAAWTPSWVRGGGGRGRSGSGRFRGIDPIIPVEDPTIIKMLVDFYGVEASFPLATHLITRSLEAAFPKRLYYVSDALLAVLLADVRESLKITATGLKLFERHELRGKELGKCQYRIAQEGLPFLLPHLTKQVIRLPVADFMRLLADRNVPLLIPSSAAGSEAETAAAAAAAKTPSNQVPLSTPSVLKQLEGLESGGAVALLDEEAAQQLGLAVDQAGSGALTANAPLAVSVWRTRASLSVLVAKNECEQMADKVRSAQQRMKQQQQGGKGAAKQAEAVAA
ncbi:hypothetical protein OEZ86_006052 [Tetradesmus obliquus]|nr:hypothetical protein OEZ86_006052 [Tetradesmus obliquus]